MRRVDIAIVSLLAIAVLIGIGLILVTLSGGILQPKEVEVTRIVPQTVEMTREVTQVVPQTEVTRLVSEQAEVTRIVPQTVEVTRVVERVVTPTPPPPTPTSARTRVLAWDGHHCSGNSFHIESRRYAEGKGWRVVEIDVEPLTYNYLREHGISVLFIADAGLAYTEREIDAIRRFVEDGGGLLLEADRHYGREIARIFGVRVLEQSLETDLRVVVQSDHPLMKDVDVFYLRGVYDPRYLAVESPAYTILEAGETEPYRPVLAAAEVGRGRVVMYPNFVYADGLREADNAYFLRNALYWLQQEDLP